MKKFTRNMKYKIFFFTMFVFVASVLAIIARSMFQDGPSRAPNSSAREVRIVLTDAGYEPSAITINRGEKVVFENASTKDMWPASDLHPTHSLYPDTGIWLCGTSASRASFDSCAPVLPGATFSFVFEHEGEWRLHDHLWPAYRGAITVR